MTKEAKTIMNNSFSYSAITVAIIAGVSLALRSFSFVAFPQGAKIPNWITRLGQVLPYGIMGFLVVYCLKDTAVLEYPYGLPQLISVALTASLQAWKKNSLLSVLAGTACYMIMIQSVFA